MRGLFSIFPFRAAVCLWVVLAGPGQADDLPEPASGAAFPVPGATSVLLGRDLFYDPVLSGNRNVSCATCHHPQNGTSDGVSMSFGEGTMGHVRARNARTDDTADRLARNAPALYNLGAAEFVRFFHDGRVERDDGKRFGVRLPVPARLERPLSPLAATVLVHLVDPDRMAGRHGENIVADAVSERRITGPDGAWQKLAERVADIAEYRRRFGWLVGRHEPIHAAHIAGSIADFIAYEFRATDSAFDAFLRGDEDALGATERHGMSLFFGRAGCARCHSGPFQTDHEFHSVVPPRFGYGEIPTPFPADRGRAAVTGNAEDLFRFRTPSLRNVTLTAPYGHSGAFASLGEMIRQHLGPAARPDENTGISRTNRHKAVAVSPDDDAPQDLDEMAAIYRAGDFTPISLSKDEISALVSFLGALTDPISAAGRLGIPDTVPSGLPVGGDAGGL